jgi:hypothetical protein
MNSDDKEFVYPNLALFRSFLDILDSALIPDDVIPHFSASYFIALHKDVLDDTKLRPIGIGTHLCHILGTLESHHHLADFAASLWPFQFAIGIPSGMQLLTHSIQNLLFKYLPGSPTTTTSSRALAFIDKTNMFNKCSRLNCKHQLDQALPDMVPIFDLLYFNDNVVWYQTPDGTWNSFLQREGYAQGCPLSGIFASTVLHKVLSTLKLQLDARAHAHLLAGSPGDDGQGSRTALGNYHDNGGMVVPFLDLHFAFTAFETIGAPHGLRSNWDKSGALVTLDPEVPPPDSPEYQAAIALLHPKKVLTRGTTFLGTPIGHHSYINEHLMHAAATFNS